MASAPPDIASSATEPGWLADLRFFATCYLAGLVFFVIMLS